MLPSRFETSQLHSSYHVTIPCFYHCISDVLSFSFSDLRRVQVQKMEKVNIVSKFLLSYRCSVWIYFLILSSIIDSDKDEGTYCPPVKRERTSSFPPPHSGKLQEAENFEFVLQHALICMLNKCSLATLQFPRTMCSCPQVFASLQPGTLTLSRVRPLLITNTARLFLLLSSQKINE